ncbi:hypothetical protein AAY85_09615 [Pseudomonas amygdali pv. lachrymans]|nr:hypothetical protein AAY85_09615 [Pseudomonas amygdali pv. lachrymans]
MRQSVINATHVSVGRISLQPLKDMQVALMKSRYTAASAQREEVTKPKDLTQDRQSSIMRTFRQLLAHIDDKCQFSSINLPCGQPTSGNISTACRACSVHFCSAPDRGDSCIMQKENGYVNDYVVNIL